MAITFDLDLVQPLKDLKTDDSENLNQVITETAYQSISVQSSHLSLFTLHGYIDHQNRVTKGNDKKLEVYFIAKLFIVTWSITLQTRTILNAPKDETLFQEHTALFSFKVKFKTRKWDFYRRGSYLRCKRFFEIHPDQFTHFLNPQFLILDKTFKLQITLILSSTSWEHWPWPNNKCARTEDVQEGILSKIIPKSNFTQKQAKWKSWEHKHRVLHWHPSLFGWVLQFCAGSSPTPQQQQALSHRGTVTVLWLPYTSSCSTDRCLPALPAQGFTCLKYIQDF